MIVSSQNVSSTGTSKCAANQRNGHQQTYSQQKKICFNTAGVFFVPPTLAAGSFYCSLAPCVFVAASILNWPQTGYLLFHRALAAIVFVPGRKRCLVVAPWPSAFFIVMLTSSLGRNRCLSVPLSYLCRRLFCHSSDLLPWPRVCLFVCLFVHSCCCLDRRRFLLLLQPLGRRPLFVKS